MAKSAKRIPFDVMGIIDNTIYTSTDVWAYYNIPTQQYNFTKDSEKYRIVELISGALKGVTENEAKDYHLIVSNRPMDVTEWASELLARSQRNDGKPEMEEYLQDIKNVIEDRNLRTKYVFLGVRLGRRDGAESAGFKDSLMNIAKLFDGILDTSPKDISDKEIDKWKEKESQAAQTILQNMKGQRLGSDDVAYLIKKQFYPAMPVTKIQASDRRSWGGGDITDLVSSYIEHERKFLRIVQTNDFSEEVEGYRAVLSMSRMPDSMDALHEPWMYDIDNIHIAQHMLESEAGEYAINVRFTVMPPALVKKDMKKKARRAIDEYQNAQGGGVAVPTHVEEQYAIAQQAQHDMERNPEYWVYATYKFVVEAATETDLRVRVNALTQHYGTNYNIQLTWTTGDQLLNLIETTPGGKQFSKSFQQIQSLNSIGGGMPTANNAVGDRVTPNGKGWLGPYLGMTAVGSAAPVFFSPHVPIAQNNAGGVLITGHPGGGKTFCALNITAQMALQGVSIVYIDPKQDAENLILAPELRDTKNISLANGEPGLLDPFLMEPKARDANLLVRDTVEFLVGERKISRVKNAGDLNRAIKTVLDQDFPSMRTLTKLLLESEDNNLQNVGEELQSLQEMQFGELLFAPEEREVKGIDPAAQAITVFSLLGTEQALASAGGKKPGDLGTSERLAMTLLLLLGKYASKLMYNLDKSKPKAIVIDEAWALVRTPQGKTLIDVFARMGRAHNTAIVLITQNAGEFLKVGDEGIANLASTIFSFGTHNDTEAEAAIKLLGIEANEESIYMINSLDPGYCLMRDVDKRVAAINIDNWNDTWFNAFQSNPEEREKLKKLIESR